MIFILALLLAPMTSFAGTFSVFDDGHSRQVGSDELHTVQLIDSNRVALKKRFELIEKAQTTIKVETYYFFPDEAGQILLKALIEKKRKSPSVHISLLFDSWASNGLSVFDVVYLESHGIEVRWFVGQALFPLGPRSHNHRKSWIFDSSTALIGGYNHGIEHMGFSPFYNMVDREILLDGPLVKSIDKSYSEVWNFSQSTLPEELSQESHVDGIEKVRLATTHETIKDSLPRFPPLQIRHLNYFSNIQRKAEISPYLKGQVEEFFLSGRQRISIETRFFIPTLSIFSVLQRKIYQGIPVQILTNNSAAVLNLERHVLNLGEVILSLFRWTGAEVRFLSGGMKDIEQSLSEKSLKATWGTHSKTYVVDGRTMIGSYNLDPVSDYLNLEHFLILDSQELADQVRQSIYQNSLN